MNRYLSNIEEGTPLCLAGTNVEGLHRFGPSVINKRLSGRVKLMLGKCQGQPDVAIGQ
jgi:hypothetical protein